MKNSFSFKLIGWLAVLLLGAAPKPAPARATVYVFLADTCPISQHATVLLRELHAAYGSQGVQLRGVFPAAQTTSADLAAFAKAYDTTFPLQLDPGRQLTRRLNATITPEAVVLAPDGRTVLYQGRLDDSYAGLGRRRTLVQHHELRDALAAIVAGRPVPVPRTEAVGCFIEK